MPEVHATLGASSAHRWLRCTPSAQLAKSYPDTGSSYAAEGTLAHTVAEWKLANATGKLAKGTLTRRINKLTKENLEVANKAFFWAVDSYVDQVLEILGGYSADASIDLECRVDFSQWVPGGFGTSDVIILDEPTIHIVDLKFGKGVPVDATNNEQLMLYALGALSDYGEIYALEAVKMTIIQPRLDSVSTFALSVDQLLKWAEDVVKPAAILADRGLGEFSPSKKTCHWCPAKNDCAARAEANMAAAVEDFKLADGPSLSNERIAEILAKLPEIEAWAKDLKQHALSEAMRGEKIPGYKLVAGRSVRKIADAEAAAELLDLEGYNPDDYSPRSLATLTQLDKLVGSKRLSEVLGDLIVKPLGKPTLVVESDNRPELSVASAADDFKN